MTEQNKKPPQEEKSSKKPVSKKNQIMAIDNQITQLEIERPSLVGASVWTGLIVFIIGPLTLALGWLLLIISLPILITKNNQIKMLNLKINALERQKNNILLI